MYRILFIDLKCELNKYKGLIIAFSLPKSSYATMALREILHRNESKLQTNHQEEQSASVTKETAIDEEEEEQIEDIVE